MSWITYEYYLDNFLRGREPLISETDFLFWADQAEDEINTNNFNNVVIDEPSVVLKRLTCELAEKLFTDSQAPRPGELIAESNASYSWQSQKGNDASEVKKEIRVLVNKRLSRAPAVEFNAFVSAAV